MLNTTYWTYTINEDSETKPSEIIGKYLFFSDSKQLLQSTGENILKEYSLHHMKISVDKNHKADPGFGYVLCIYSNNNLLMNELKSKEVPGLNYRFFKTDAATRAGIYSTQYNKIR